MNTVITTVTEGAARIPYFLLVTCETFIVEGCADFRAIVGLSKHNQSTLLPASTCTRAYFVPLLQDFTIDGQVWDDDVIEGIDEDNASDAYSHSLLHADGECFYSGRA